ncbi:nectin-3 isoform B [Alligator mississippiensis]|nr:nectin-3 isoform B [Alligator mississippiensis]
MSLWASPVVLVQKQDGSIRFCIDYRKLNAITTPDAYRMPRMDTLLDRLGPAKVISTLDLSKGFWQLALDPDAIAESAFTTPVELYEFTVLPFSMHNSPASFQRLINNLLQGCEQFAMAYIDDIAIFSQDFESHLIHLTTMLGKIKQAGLTVKAKKCQWALSEVVYLGHRVGGGHIAPLWDKIKAIRDWLPPQTKKQVRAFLGLAGYYRRFVPGFRATAAPLHELTEKGSPDPVVWKQGCQEAFDTLKAALIKQPILKTPLHDKPFYVATDASDSGLGAVLLQEHQETRHPMVYLSRKLIPQEQNLSSIKKECLAIIWALNKLRPYLWGQQFTVLSDHAPLQWLQTMQNTDAKLQRWAWQLQEFNFTVKHIKGSQNMIADALS